MAGCVTGNAWRRRPPPLGLRAASVCRRAAAASVGVVGVWAQRLVLLFTGVSAGGAAVGAAREPALLGMRGLYYNRAGRSLLHADNLPTPAHPMAA